MHLPAANGSRKFRRHEPQPDRPDRPRRQRHRPLRGLLRDDPRPAETLPLRRLAFFDCAGVRPDALAARERPGPVIVAQGAIYFRVADLLLWPSKTFEIQGRRHRKPEPHLAAPMPDHDLWMAFIRDPDGHLIGLMMEAPKGYAAAPQLAPALGTLPDPALSPIDPRHEAPVTPGGRARCLFRHQEMPAPTQGYVPWQKTWLPRRGAGWARGPLVHCVVKAGFRPSSTATRKTPCRSRSRTTRR